MEEKTNIFKPTPILESPEDSTGITVERKNSKDTPSSIFKFLLNITGNSDRKKEAAFRSWFTRNLPESEFIGINRYLYLIVEYVSSLNTMLSETVLTKIIERKTKEFLSHTGIKTDAIRSLNLRDPVDLDRASEILQTEITTALELLRFNSTEFETFEDCIVDFFATQKSRRVEEICSMAMEIKTIGVNGKVGPDDALSYMQSSVSIINDIYNLDKLQILLSGKQTEGYTPRLITRTGIKSIDKDTQGGIYSGELWGLEAAPGIGKTRMAVGNITLEALYHKQDVLYFALEQNKDEVEAQLLASHIARVLNKRISSTKIYKRVGLNEQEIKLIDFARQDLFNSGKYGKIVIEHDISLNRFKETLEDLDNLKGPFDLFVVDHMFLVSYTFDKRYGVLTRADVAAKSYREFKIFIQNTDRAGLAVNQLNNEGIKAAKAGQDPGQTGAAGGIEVYRNTDYNMVLFETSEMERKQRIGIFNPKSRGAKGVSQVMCVANKDVCFFFEIEHQT